MERPTAYYVEYEDAEQIARVIARDGSLDFADLAEIFSEHDCETLEEAKVFGAALADDCYWQASERIGIRREDFEADGVLWEQWTYDESVTVLCKGDV